MLSNAGTSSDSELAAFDDEHDTAIQPQHSMIAPDRTVTDCTSIIRAECLMTDTDW